MGHHGLVRLSRRAEEVFELVREDPSDRRRSVRPRHLNATGVVREVFEPELEERTLGTYELAHLVRVHRTAVWGEAHHLALVSVVREPEPLRDCGVEDPEGVREQDAVE